MKPILRSAVPDHKEARPHFDIIPFKAFELAARPVESTLDTQTTDDNEIKADIVQQGLQAGRRDFSFAQDISGP